MSSTDRARSPSVGFAIGQGLDDIAVDAGELGVGQFEFGFAGDVLGDAVGTGDAADDGLEIAGVRRLTSAGKTWKGAGDLEAALSSARAVSGGGKGEGHQGYEFLDGHFHGG